MQINKSKFIKFWLIVIILLVCFLVVGFFIYQKLGFGQKNTKSDVKSELALVTDQKKEFESKTLGLKITVNKDDEVVEKSQGNIILISDNVMIYKLDEDPEKCVGVCSKIERSDEVEVNGNKAKKLYGVWQEIAETSSQKFVSYVFKKDKSFLIFQIQELPFDAEYQKGRKVNDIDQKSLDHFEEIVKTVQFI